MKSHISTGLYVVQNTTISGGGPLQTRYTIPHHCSLPPPSLPPLFGDDHSSCKFVKTTLSNLHELFILTRPGCYLIYLKQ